MHQAQAQLEDGAVEPLASYANLVSRFGLFHGGSGVDASACAPEPHATAGFACACAGCTRWKAFVAGRLPSEGGTHPRYEARGSLWRFTRLAHAPTHHKR
jgi:hypothetical protein